MNLGKCVTNITRFVGGGLLAAGSMSFVFIYMAAIPMTALTLVRWLEVDWFIAVLIGFFLGPLTVLTSIIGTYYFVVADFDWKAAAYPNNTKQIVYEDMTEEEFSKFKREQLYPQFSESCAKEINEGFLSDSDSIKKVALEAGHRIGLPTEFNSSYVTALIKEYPASYCECVTPKILKNINKGNIQTLKSPLSSNSWFPKIEVSCHKESLDPGEWLPKASESGNADAQFVLGMMYAGGIIFPKDFVLAYEWLALAAAQGQQVAEKARAALSLEMTPAQIEEAQRLAKEFQAASDKALDEELDALTPIAGQSRK